MMDKEYGVLRKAFKEYACLQNKHNLESMQIVSYLCGPSDTVMFGDGEL
jgi:hypothetical protein